MTLNRIVAAAVILTSTCASIPVRAEAREGVLVPKPTLAARPINSLAGSPGDRQLVQVPSPTTRMPGVRPTLRGLMWAAIGVGTFLTVVGLTIPKD
jgi:hypothetical protein